MVDQIKLLFYNKMMDRTAIKQLISRLIAQFGITYTTNILDQLKTLGFKQATNASVSLGIDDLLEAPSKAWLIQDAERQGSIFEQHHRFGSVHAVEKLRQLIETWYATSEYLKREMIPNFRIIDPLNPVHMMSFSGARGSTSQVHQLVGMRGLMSDPQGQIIDLPIRSNLREGLSLTEYIISCYGARKGVVDTAVRTSDAGYLTRRLVEVVQHIVVRKMDCGSTRGIPFKMTQDRFKRNLYQQRLIGRVLADNVYLEMRCIAMRNQDIGNELANRLITIQKQLVYVRSPLTRKSISWVCQLCYGWSLTHQNLVELGEAVGIIAGQSIGEPGTQLTLRTFHTGGVFTGDIAEHIRIPFNGIISFAEDSVHPIRTRHGHPAWICQDNLSVSVKNKNRIHNVIIPYQSLILVQNNQYVESKQVIAEVRINQSLPKERVKKHIYSNSEGEMHWSTIVRHSPQHRQSNVYPVLKTGHIWILSGSLCNVIETSSSFYKEQDRFNIQSVFTKPEFLPYSFGRNKGEKNQLTNLHKKGQELNHLKFDSSATIKTYKFPYLTSLFYCKIRKDKTENKVILSIKPIQRRNKYYRKTPYRDFVFQTPTNGILNRGDILAIHENPEYRIHISGVIKYGTLKIDSIVENERIPNDREKTTFGSRYKVLRGGNFFFLPGEIYIVHESSAYILVSNNSIVQAGTQITPTLTSQLGGLVQIKNIQKSFEIRILPGTIHHPKRIPSISKQNNMLIPPGQSVFDNLKFDHWIYLQWITSPRKKTFALARPVIEYFVRKGSYPPILNLLKEQNTLRVKFLDYMLYEDGEEIQIKNNMSIQLVQTCLLLDWEKKSPIKAAKTSILELRINKIIKTFLQISLLNSFDFYVKGSKFKRFFNNKKSFVADSIPKTLESQLSIKHQGTIRSVSNRKTSFLVLSPSDSFQNSLSTNFQYYDSKNRYGKKKELKWNTFFDTKKVSRSLKKNYLSSIKDSEKRSLNSKVGLTSVSSFDHTRQLQGMKILGLLGYLYSIANCFLYPKGIFRNEVFFHRDSSIDDLVGFDKLPNWYFLDENRKIYSFHLRNLIGKRFFYWTRNLSNFNEIPLVNLGQFICEGARLFENQISSQSGQIIALSPEFLIIRLAILYLATKGATIHNHYGDLLREGDTLITLTYERFKSGDIIQGLPKVEQLLEARSVNAVSRNIEDNFKKCNRVIAKFIESPWSFFFSAKISTEQSRKDLVDQIQGVYQSQGVQISDKHIEIIVRQMTSKVLTLEDGIATVFLPGELIELPRAQRMNRALKQLIYYKPILLGITKASLNTTSFLSEASFQETTRVLARAAIRGRIDWLKGLKENVIIGGIVPTGTGSREVTCQMDLEKHKKGSNLKIKNTHSFSCEIKDLLFNHGKVSLTFKRSNIHRELKKPLSENDSD
uniref:DNA-directed RNA polymerase subunit beta'' n=1 Tax=Psilotum nudum TaxID=3240 RepID=M9PII0_PSINU|nr:DNA-directed RNA polymerase subunit beta' [Psilotum nudum]